MINRVLPGTIGVVLTAGMVTLTAGVCLTGCAVPCLFTPVTSSRRETTCPAATCLAFFLLGPSPQGNGGHPGTLNLQMNTLMEPTPVSFSLSVHLLNGIQ